MMGDHGGMKFTPLSIALLAFLLADGAGTAFAGPPSPVGAQSMFGGGTRNFTVRGFERVRVDGPVAVTLKTGVPPYARATGKAREQVDVTVQGRTLVVRWKSDQRRGYRGDTAGPVTLEIGTHEIEEAWVNGSGQLDIDRVERRDFTLSVQGSGGASVAAIEVDTLDLGVAGAGNIRIAGEAKKATLLVRGMSNLDADRLAVDNLVLGVDGPGMARVNAKDAIKIDAIGTGDISVTGKPACTINAQGSPRILGC